MKSLPVFSIKDFEERAGELVYVSDLKEHIGKYDFIGNPHKHNFHLLLLTESEGNHYVDFVNHHFSGYTLHYLAPGRAHRWIFKSEKPKGRVIFFYEDLFGSCGNVPSVIERLSFLNVPSPYPIHNLTEEDWNDAQWCVGKIESQNGSMEFGADIFVKNTMEMLLVIFERLSLKKGVSSVDPRSRSWKELRRFQLLLERNFETRHQVNWYADQMNVSTSRLKQLCKVCMSDPPGRMIKQRRLLEVKRLLKMTSMSFSQIAAELNFTDLAHLSHFFLKSEGVTMREFREA
ncbi:helix-turn-helix domain-containing protein [Aureibacter tunicatorum]|uniref:AraC-like DNA-binding protein n=1 Tax=Aureibacter tunicatorum TaxID=866807 RepID=A0AAE4BR77_9BACT|nr:AraC family transcriptional regulator [Aureibacter tunicatorum]MDR6238376.1 AraC-like DNA-binding protein [Aureibacter tunicatorum]BDD03408.1 AraC family transcriptional regulator [Aureibacter tunicatorum]